MKDIHHFCAEIQAVKRNFSCKGLAKIVLMM
jgi:hypothetical protein